MLVRCSVIIVSRVQVRMLCNQLVVLYMVLFFGNSLGMWILKKVMLLLYLKVFDKVQLVMGSIMMRVQMVQWVKCVSLWLKVGRFVGSLGGMQCSWLFRWMKMNRKVSRLKDLCYQQSCLMRGLWVLLQGVMNQLLKIWFRMRMVISQCSMCMLVGYLF